MKYTCFVLGVVLAVFLVCFAEATPQELTRDPQNAHDIVTLVGSLPWELQKLYYLIINPTTDEIRKENYIWRAFELLKLKIYKEYLWFYEWLVDYQRGYGRQGPGRYTPRHGGPGGRTRGHGGPGGRTHGHGHGPGGHRVPGGRTKHRGGPGERTHGHHGRHH